MDTNKVQCVHVVDFSTFEAANSIMRKLEGMEMMPVSKKNNRNRDGPCGKRCFVVTTVALFLFLTFVALPAGAFLIIHGRHQNSLAFQLGGAAVVCVPILVGIILSIVFCVRRHRRKATFTSVSTAHV